MGFDARTGEGGSTVTLKLLEGSNQKVSVFVRGHARVHQLEASPELTGCLSKARAGVGDVCVCVCVCVYN